MQIFGVDKSAEITVNWSMRFGSVSSLNKMKFLTGLQCRSLADFSKIVEILDARGASFVSVTQQFNATTSMGFLSRRLSPAGSRPRIRLHPICFVNRCGRRCRQEIDQRLGGQRLLGGGGRTRHVYQIRALQIGW